MKTRHFNVPVSTGEGKAVIGVEGRILKIGRCILLFTDKDVG